MKGIFLKNSFKKHQQKQMNNKLATYKNRKHLLLETGQEYNLLNHYEPRIFVSKNQKDLSTKTGYCTETNVFTDGQWQKQRQTHNIIRSQSYCSHIKILESKWVLFKRENSNLLLEYIVCFSCTILKGVFYLILQ